MITKTALNVMRAAKGLKKINPESIGVEIKKVKKWKKPTGAQKLDPNNIGMSLSSLKK